MINFKPKNFYWGAATASYQVEGGIENTDWAKAAREGRVPPCGRACDHYHRYEEDFDIAQSLGHNAHRFSIEWARIEPEEGKFDEETTEHYRRVLRALRDRNLEPFVTLWHFTLPLWFAQSGGFERKDAPKIFARYCQYIVEQLGDLCLHFSTMNEPNVYATHGYLYGVWPPFQRVGLMAKGDGTEERAQPQTKIRNYWQYWKVASNLVKAHNTAYACIKAARPDTQVSVIKHVHVFDANERFINKLLARVAQYLQTDAFLLGIKGSFDAIGLNYYRSTRFGETRNFLQTDMGWNALPSGIYNALLHLQRYQKPIFIAEAGLADEDDDLRPQYLTVQIMAMQRAIQDGVDVRGHLYWSLLDNYEWALGFEKRFGIVEIDYDTLERKIRPSAYVYKRIIENNGIVE